MPISQIGSCWRTRAALAWPLPYQNYRIAHIRPTDYLMRHIPGHFNSDDYGSLLALTLVVWDGTMFWMSESLP